MLSSRKILRREFFRIFPLAFANANKHLFSYPHLPERKFLIGDRIINSRICDDRISLNYGVLEWEKGFIICFCWNYYEWLIEEYKSGWTYFIRFDETSNPDYFTEPFFDFEHENRIAIA